MYKNEPPLLEKDKHPSQEDLSQTYQKDIERRKAMRVSLGIFQRRISAQRFENDLLRLGRSNVGALDLGPRSNLST